jgi:predicted RNA methylase
MEYGLEKIIIMLELLNIFITASKNNKVEHQQQARTKVHLNNNNQANSYVQLLLTFKVPYTMGFHKKNMNKI